MLGIILAMFMAMAYQSGHDCWFWGTSAARDGLTAVPVAAGELNFPVGGGAPGVGTQVYPKGNAIIRGVLCITEAIANLTEYRWHKTTDPNWTLDQFHKADQTADWVFDTLFGHCNYPIQKGDTLILEAANGNNAQGDWFAAFVDALGQARISGSPFGPIPANAQWVDFDSDTNSVADTITRTAIQPDDYNLERDATYTVWAGRCQMATGVFARLVSLTSDDRPMIPVSDTEICGGPVYWAPYGLKFTGLQGLYAEVLSAGAEASLFSLLISKDGGK